MQLWLISLLILLVLFAVASAAIVLRRSAPTPPTRSERSEAIDEIRRERQRASEALGSVLLDRRVQLDSRRVALQGVSHIEDQVHELEERLQAGEITEDQFEQEKSRLLSG